MRAHMLSSGRGGEPAPARHAGRARAARHAASLSAGLRLVRTMAAAAAAVPSSADPCRTGAELAPPTSQLQQPALRALQGAERWLPIAPVGSRCSTRASTRTRCQALLAAMATATATASGSHRPTLAAQQAASPWLRTHYLTHRFEQRTGVCPRRPVHAQQRAVGWHGWPWRRRALASRPPHAAAAHVQFATLRLRAAAVGAGRGTRRDASRQHL